MRLEQFLKLEYLEDNLQANNKTEALTELSEMVIKGHLKLNKLKIFEVLQQREKLGSTGIGDGVAIPHGKIGNLDELIVVFARCKKGVDFESIDGKPVHLFFLLLAPENSTGQHLKALAKISKMLKAGNFRKKLMDAKSNSDLYKIIIEQDETCLL
ncbi:MAG: PTS fructose transporter subunit IIA [Deltaproteobacteria bacterium HGW-Deltaproteobacteria-10]|nr:MAG: PTS fructose transporter subunit IIA [Deltaproteobacteria bacterium HGW-Deltaproteobacteria-10]